MSAAQLYDTDFAEWARQNAELLRAGRAGEADLEHIAEEIEDMAKRLRHGVRSRLSRLMQHFLKWQLQPTRRSRSWEVTILQQRLRIRELLEENPSFQPEMQSWIDQMYEQAVRLAAIETGIAREAFPKSWPYTVAQTLDQDFLPD